MTSKYHVYQYTFLDDLTAVMAPAKAFHGSGLDLDNEQQAVCAAFTAAGWEGDGEIGVIWLPPFLDVGVEDTHGTLVWHVKQSNNGISWLASEVPLTFPRLLDQNS